ncbi:MAG: nucleotide exchange factor GrpE [bacterium]|nr:nucleotide exchange factor GrpE [bacterium]
MAKSKKPVVTNDAQIQLARALADYQNLAKRFEKEKLEVILRANKNLIEELLPVVDSLENAQMHLGDEGLKMGMDNLKNVFSRYGISEVEATEGDNFDSSLHEAIDTLPGGKAGTVASIITKGYKWNDGQILRPTKVVVFK